MGGNETIPQPRPSSLHLNLQLQVTAVILSAAKNPEELNPPQPAEAFFPAILVASWD
jgi:hypothetical protein